MKAQGTETAEGFIPHLEVMFDGGVIHAPVKLQRRPEYMGPGLLIKELYGRQKLPVPKRCGSALVFALPNGGELLR